MRGRRIAAGAAGGLLAATIALPAVAAPVSEIVQGRVLRIVSVADWDAASSLRPGEPVRWDVAVSADADEPGTVTIAASARGDAPLRVDAALCMRAWEGDLCPGGADVLQTAWLIPRDGRQVALADFSAEEVGHLRLRIALDDDVPGVTEVRVHAIGVGESLVVGPDAPLPATGGPLAPWAIAAGAALAAGGAALVLVRRRDEEETER